MLSPYRVLDLTDEKGLLCGKMLGELGADVIKIERPGGDPARNIGPFYHDEPGPEKSLFWFAYNTNKRGITLDIEKSDGQEIFKRLVKTADFVIESFPPGYMDKLGLGHKALEKLNPRLIMASITPFGQTGPYKDYKASDITAWAMGGHLWGEPDRPPYRIGFSSQAYLFAGAAAAVGVIMAFHQRATTGEGQHVDVSIQEAVACQSSGETLLWDVHKTVRARGEPHRPGAQLPRTWPCKDGIFTWGYYSGPQGKRRTPRLLQWMEAEGKADPFLTNFDWKYFDLNTLKQDVAERITEATGNFFRQYTKAELFKGAGKYHVMGFPMSTTTDIVEDAQLASRDYWVRLEHPELSTTITYPGAFTKSSETPPKIVRRAPLIGEHNQEVFKELQEFKQGKDALYKKPIARINSEARKRKLLEGIKVVDFCWLVAGPLVTKTLADYGAEVIKLEGRTVADSWRTLGPFRDNKPGYNRSFGFTPYNSSKKSFAVNLAKPKGIELAKKLVAWADIAVENFSGGTIQRMGLSYEKLKKVNPDIIMLSASMFGQTGPHFDHPGTGNTLTGLSGFAQITGWPDREFPHLGIYTDHIAPYYSLLAILAALDYRRRTGKGQYFDMSQYETGVHFLAPLILDRAENGRNVVKMGNHSEYAAPHGLYRCRGEDRWCAIAVFTSEEWKNFCRVIGDPEWTRDVKFGTLLARMENVEELNKLIETWTINHSAEEVMTLMQAANIVAGVFQTGEDLIEHDVQLKYRHFYREVDHSEMGKYHANKTPFILSKADCEIGPAPLLGEHNEYVCRNILGMADDEIYELVTEGVIE